MRTRVSASSLRAVLVLMLGWLAACTPSVVPTCEGCSVGEVCYAAGVVNPDNPCERCSPDVDSDGWTPADGAICDDGLFCNGADTCLAGACAEHVGSPCGDGLTCDEAASQCTVACAGCEVDGACWAQLQANPDNACQHCDTRVATDAWTTLGDGASCDDGSYCNGLDTCASGVCTHDGDPCLLGTCWEDGGGQCCSALADPTCNKAEQVVTADSCGHQLSVVRDCDLCDDGHCVCDPVAQTGCDALTERCTVVDEVVTCVADGTVALGEACTFPVSGADDCQAGAICDGGVCVEICTDDPDSCAEGFACVPDALRFGDAHVGSCVQQCDPVAQDCVDDEQACYLQAVTGLTSCTGVPVSSEGRVQDDACYGPDAGVCYLNGCDVGYGGNLPDNDCAFFCNPVDSWLDNAAGVAGDPSGITCASTFGGDRPDGPGGAYQCRYLQTFYSNTDLVEAHIGMCVDPAEHGDCASYDWVQFQADLLSGAAEDPDYCLDHPDRCVAGCVSSATWDAATSP